MEPHVELFDKATNLLQSRTPAAGGFGKKVANQGSDGSRPRAAGRLFRIVAPARLRHAHSNDHS